MFALLTFWPDLTLVFVMVKRLRQNHRLARCQRLHTSLTLYYRPTAFVSSFIADFGGLIFLTGISNNRVDGLVKSS